MDIGQHAYSYVTNIMNPYCAGLIKSVRAVLRGIPLHILVRPRGGDFVYTRLELQVT